MGSSKKNQSFVSRLGVRNKRVYTMTTAQYIVGFLISISFSMLLGPLFERYAPRYLSTAATAMQIIANLHSETSNEDTKKESAKPPSRSTHTPNAHVSNPYNALRLEVRKLSNAHRHDTGV